MAEKLRPKDVLVPLSALGLLVFASLFCFSKEQKAYIRERDGGCMFPEPHPCNYHHKTPQIHHILPGRYSEVIGIAEPDFEENGITLCEYAHQKLVHPDMAEALEAYRKGDKEAFAKAFAARDELLAERKTYWVTTWDRIFHAIAVRNSQRARAMGKEFPLTKRQRQTQQEWLNSSAAAD